LRLGEAETLAMRSQIEGWGIDDLGHLRKAFGFKNFVEAVEFVNAITAVAEEAGHHPDLTVRWGEVGVELWTHAIKGLSQNDFVLAARIDRISRRG
jgi:4a-hydroxytetrahydrobiopterin dehydratase